MSYMSWDKYRKYRGDCFILHEKETYDGDLLILEGNVIAECGACFMSELKLIPDNCVVTLEEKSIVGHLHFMNGGHLHLKGKCIICEYFVEGPVTLHVSRSLPNWKDCFSCCDDEVSEEDFELIIIED